MSIMAVMFRCDHEEVFIIAVMFRCDHKKFIIVVMFRCDHTAHVHINNKRQRTPLTTNLTVPLKVPTVNDSFVSL